MELHDHSKDDPELIDLFVDTDLVTASISNILLEQGHLILPGMPITARAVQG